MLTWMTTKGAVTLTAKPSHTITLKCHLEKMSLFIQRSCQKYLKLSVHPNFFWSKKIFSHAEHILMHFSSGPVSVSYAVLKAKHATLFLHTKYLDIFKHCEQLNYCPINLNLCGFFYTLIFLHILDRLSVYFGEH